MRDRTDYLLGVIISLLLGGVLLFLFLLVVSAARADEIRTDEVVFSCYFLVDEKYDVENKWGNVTTLVRKVTLGPLFVTENQLNDIGRGITIVVKASGEHVRIPGGSGYSCFGAI
jgi:hypothetical protein